MVIHEAFGINDDIRRKADEMTAHGYLAVAPDLYQGKSWPGCVRKAIAQLKSGSGPAFDAIDATRAMLAGRPDCTGKVGVIKILRLSYNPEDAADAWQRIYAFFGAELGGADEISEAGQTGS